MKSLPSYLIKTAGYLTGTVVFALLVTAFPGPAAGRTSGESVENAYRMANFVVAYSTPQERNVLSHYADVSTLPASYQTARLIKIHESMQTLAATETPVNVVRYSADAILSTPVSELTAIQRIGEDSNGVGVQVTVHSLDLRSNLRLIASFEEALVEGREIPKPEWLSLVDDNPWRREIHRWRQEEEAWRMVDDRVAMLKVR